MSYTIITDSCCDLPDSYRQTHSIEILPLYYRIGTENYINAPVGGLSTHEFYTRVRDGEMPTTAQVSVDQFIQAFLPHLEAGKDILYIGFSSALSGTYNSSLVARDTLLEQFPERKIVCIDSLCASMGQGLLIHFLLEKRASGMDFDSICAWASANYMQIAHWFTVSDLNHLRRGGRVSAFSAFVGTMLNIKPVLHVDNEGRLIPMEKVKGRKKALQALVDHMEETLIKLSPSEQTVFISHGDNEADALLLKDMIMKRLGAANFLIGDIGPVIGSHAGPDTIALFFLASKR